MNKDKKLLINSSILLLVSIILACSLFWVYKNSLKSLKTLNFEEKNTEVKQEILYQRKIDGKMIEDSSNTDLYPVGIIIENNYEAWPLSGIDKAQVVYEFEAEAGIPRLLALFAADEKINKIGPVRSVRPYYIDMNQGYGALLAHCGGSPEALAQIKEYGVEDLNEFYYGSNFWRDEARSAPHNVFTSTELLKQALDKRELNGPTEYSGWQYVQEDATEQNGKIAENVSIDFSAAIYKAVWKYNQEKQSYQRFQDTDPVITADNQEVWAKNVIVVEMKRQILDEIGRRKFNTIGSGKALIFTAGKVVEGKWEKDERDGREKFIDNQGNEIKLNRGNTWVEVARTMEVVQY